MGGYSFRGKINAGKDVPFAVEDGIARFDVLSKSLLPFDKRRVLLCGLTDSGKNIYILVDHFYECQLDYVVDDNSEVVRPPRIEGVVEACMVLDSGRLEDVNSIGFYSVDIPKVTNIRISGALNDDNSFGMNIKKRLGKYRKDEREYSVSIGFVEEKPFYRGQMLVLGAEGKMSIDEIRDSYWLMKRMLSFLYQKRIFPLEGVYLRNGRENIGRLYVEKPQSKGHFRFQVKCLPVLGWGDRFSNLLQALADDRIYLRHIPIFKEDDQSVTPGRFLMGLVGLESMLDLTDVHVNHGGKKLRALEAAKERLTNLKDQSSGDEKEIYKMILKNLKKDEKFANRIRISIEENAKYISNFFPLGKGTEEVAEDLATVRNSLAHGNLNEGVSSKGTYQMQFLMLYILYLQLEMIGFSKKEASEKVLGILFSRVNS